MLLSSSNVFIIFTLYIISSTVDWATVNSTTP